MLDSMTGFDGSTLSILFKILLLALIAIFGVFTFIIYRHLKSLNKIVAVKDIAGAPLIRSAGLFFAIVAASLFVLALVIL